MSIKARHPCGHYEERQSRSGTGSPGPPSWCGRPPRADARLAPGQKIDSVGLREGPPGKPLLHGESIWTLIP
jgi:hypothetical protein